MSIERQKIGDLSQERRKELEGDWRAGLLPARTVALKYNLEVNELKAFARSEGWDKGDLGSAIQSETTRALVKRAVGESATDQVSRETVQKYGAVVASIVESHRTDVKELRLFTNRVLADLREMYAEEDFDESRIDNLVALISDKDPEFAKLLKGPKKSVLPKVQRLAFAREVVQLIKDATIAFEKLITLERQAWALDQKGKDAGASYDDFLAELHGEDNGTPASAGRTH